MARRRLPYEEGTWFALPLDPSGWALGVVARTSRRVGGLLGYFFGPRRDLQPTLDDATVLVPHDAVATLVLGDLGLIHGEWPILGELTGWRREEWPMPRFIRHDAVMSSRAYLVTYADDEIFAEIGEEPVSPDVEGYEEDGLDGYESARLEVSRRLG